MFEVLELPKTEVERKPQGNARADFIKLTLEHKGGSPEERERSSELARGLVCWVAATSWDNAASRGLVWKGGLVRVSRSGI